jgi:hypothetical protein
VGNLPAYSTTAFWRHPCESTSQRPTAQQRAEQRGLDMLRRMEERGKGISYGVTATVMLHIGYRCL